LGPVKQRGAHRAEEALIQKHNAQYFDALIASWAAFLTAVNRQAIGRFLLSLAGFLLM
jgi:hypothetical protein